VRAVDQFAAGVIGRLLDGAADDRPSERRSWRFAWIEVQPFEIDRILLAPATMELGDPCGPLLKA
jgi:hypothetical protein